MKSYISPKVNIKLNSQIEGKTAYAVDAIKKDEIIAIKNGHIISGIELDHLDNECKQYCLQIDDNFFIGPIEKDEIETSAIFVNHSCEPNIGNRGDITIIALRDIAIGEELTHDYATCYTRVDQFGNFKCNCGNKNCRNIITGEDWKIKKLQKKYSGYFSPYIEKKIYTDFSH